MTSKLKCPFCQQELHKDPDGYYSCYTDNCSVMNAGGNGASGTESLWQALIQAKQDLVIAKSTLEYLGYEFPPAYPEKNVIAEMRQKARNAVKYIEHKESE